MYRGYGMQLNVEYLEGYPAENKLKKIHKCDVGYDLHAWLRGQDSEVLLPGEIKMVSAGFKVALPRDYWMEIVPRGCSLTKWGLYIQHGTVDPGYTGEVLVLMQNIQFVPVRIDAGNRIAQLIIHQVEECEIVECDSAEEKSKELLGEDWERGDVGIGATGV